MVGDRCPSVQPSSEPGRDPVHGREEDFDAVVDAVLNQEECRSHGRQVSTTLDDVDRCGHHEQRWAREKSGDRDREHQRDGSSPSFPTRRHRLVDVSIEANRPLVGTGRACHCPDRPGSGAFSVRMMEVSLSSGGLVGNDQPEHPPESEPMCRLTTRFAHRRRPLPRRPCRSAKLG